MLYYSSPVHQTASQPAGFFQALQKHINQLRVRHVGLGENEPVKQLVHLESTAII